VLAVAALNKRVPGARGCDVSHPELLVEFWAWKPSCELRWTKENLKGRNHDLYRAGDTLATGDTHGAFNHIPAYQRRRARASLSRALARLHERQLVDFVYGTGCYSGGMVLTPHGEQVARQLAAASPDMKQVA
jgi:hypothetical protein